MAKQRRGAILQEPGKVKQPRWPLAWKKLFKHAATLALVVVLVAGGMYLREADTLPVKERCGFPSRLIPPTRALLCDQRRGRS